MNKQIVKKNAGNATHQNTVIRAVTMHFSKKKRKLNRKFKQALCINVVVICLGGSFCLVCLVFVLFNKISIITASLRTTCATLRQEPGPSQLCWCVLQKLSWSFQPVSGQKSVLLPRKGAKNKAQEKKVVHNTAAHHLLTDALPMPEQSSTPRGQFPPVYILNIL